MRNVSDPSCRENQNTHFVFNNFFRKSYRLWDNVKKYDVARQATDNTIIQRIHFACWITKATDTHSEYVIFIAFSRQQWWRERDSVLRQSYIACLVSTVAHCVNLSGTIAHTVSERRRNYHVCSFPAKWLLQHAVHNRICSKAKWVVCLRGNVMSFNVMFYTSLCIPPLASFIPPRVCVRVCVRVCDFHGLK
jgi:hypothetical protein